MNKRVVHIIPHQHFDLIWRRDLDWYENRRRQLYHQVFKMLRENTEFTFTFCQVWPLRSLLEHEPELKPEFTAWLKNGRIEIAGGTETIPDLNLSSPLAIDRNIAMGRQWLQDEFGYEVIAAAFEDAFGVSAQLPQLLNLNGYRFYKAGRMPRPGQDDLCGDFLWEGLDGSVVKCVSPGPQCCSWGWGYPDNPDEDQNVNMAIRGQRIQEQLKKAVSANQNKNVLFVVMGEEHDIYPELCMLVKNMNHEHPELEFRFSSYLAYFNTLSADYWDKVPIIRNDIDLSRIFTGCYTSRQESKTLPRHLEHRILAAEAGGAPIERTCWESLFLLEFHDAAGGCHIDENADRLKTFYSRSMRLLQNSPSVIPWPRALPIPYCTALISHPESGTVKCGNWSITFSSGRFAGAAYCGLDTGTFCELSLREDNGTMWTEEYSGKSRIFAAEEDEIIAWHCDDCGARLVTGGSCNRFKEMWPGFSILTYRRTVTFTAASPLVQIEYDLDWLGSSTEIAVRWDHCGRPQSSCRAEIPFGSVIRRAYSPVMMQGDVFPALNWVRNENFAVINQGTPAHALRNGQLETLLLRSPVKRWAPWFPVTPSEAAWDNGKRRFKFIYYVFNAPPETADLHRLGMEFNIAAAAIPEYQNLKIFSGLPKNVVIAGLRNTGPGKWEILLFEAEGISAVWQNSDLDINMAFKPCQIIKETVYEK